MMKPIKPQKGFTLLEVMIAITIMAIAFGAILTSQSGSIHRSIKTKDLNLAGWLGHSKMVESEHLLEGKPFSELDNSPTIKKFDAPFDKFTWKREIKEIKFPDLIQATEGQPVPERVRILGKTITKFLNDSIRELVVTITWERGKGEQTLVISTYLIDMDAEFSFSI